MSRRHQKGISSEKSSLASSSTEPTRPSEVVSKSVGQKSLWNRLKENLGYWAIWFFFAAPIVVPVVLGVVYVPFYRGSLTSVEFTVDRRERVTQGGGENTKSFYLVWSKEGEVFCVSDTWSFMTFDSADRYGKLHENSKVAAKVAGWRVPFLSWYRNVVEINEVKSPEAP